MKGVLKMAKLYIAYGSNMNLEQMAYRCPTARVKGVGKIAGWKLTFRGADGSAVATIEPCKKGEVPVLLWEIEPSDEVALDRYEGYPWLYRKEIIPVIFENEAIEAMAYIMNEGRPIGTPSPRYYETIRQGYESAGLDEEYLKKACIKAKRKSR